MAAARKITESENILAKLQNLPDEQFKVELENFIKTIHEVFSHLLEEYNVKFDCKIERISLEKFKVKAKKTGKIEAINFLIWYEKEYKKIRNNSEFGYLLERNNDHIHTPRTDIINACTMLINETKAMTYYAYENF
ncbi:MAG: hypothetical protein ACT4NT_04250 [Nitrososphaerota archaeon]